MKWNENKYVLFLAKDVDGAEAAFAQVVRPDHVEDEMTLLYDQGAQFLVGFT